ncbi:hypothetical protein V6N11_068199 [Hibiscus sabdariffa]|uniref:Uncharacterized protein n=1 Tax=Hibiscus sabdariffa TaxID=183260 RepID=A0ABR2STB4_9ROSI
MLQLHLCKCFGNLLKKDDKGDASAETTGPAWAAISESRQVLVSAALADSGSLIWSCISTAHICFDLLLLPYASYFSCAPQSA